MRKKTKQILFDAQLVILACLIGMLEFVGYTCIELDGWAIGLGDFGMMLLQVLGCSILVTMVFGLIACGIMWLIHTREQTKIEEVIVKRKLL